jgi:hypothetical protein
VKCARAGIVTCSREPKLQFDQSLCLETARAEQNTDRTTTTTTTTTTTNNNNNNSVALVRERTPLTERPPLVAEVSANFCEQRDVA